VILGTTLVGFGVGWVTSTSSSQSGWVLIIFGIIVQFASITVFFLPRLRGTRTDGQHGVTPTAK
jgi:F0F1-type ATP synthase assembly protein I